MESCCDRTPKNWQSDRVLQLILTNAIAYYLVSLCTALKEATLLASRTLKKNMQSTPN
jgi:hypothetical protein